MIVYASIPQIIQSCTTLQARIDMVDIILNNLEIAIADAATSGKFESYKLDTGQTKNEVIYRSIAELNKAHEGLFQMQLKMIARLNNNKSGRVMRMVDEKQFIRNRNGYTNW